MVYIVHTPTKQGLSPAQQPPVYNNDTAVQKVSAFDTSDLLSISQATLDAYRERQNQPTLLSSPIGAVPPTEVELQAAAEEVRLDVLSPPAPVCSAAATEETAQGEEGMSLLFQGFVFVAGVASIAFGILLVPFYPLWLVATCSSMVAAMCWAVLCKDALAGLHSRSLWYEDLKGYHEDRVAERATWWFKWLVVVSVVLSSGAVAEYGAVKWRQEERPWLEDLALLGGILSLYSRMLSFIGYSVLSVIVWLNDRQGHYRTPMLSNAKC